MKSKFAKFSNFFPRRLSVRCRRPNADWPGQLRKKIKKEEGGKERGEAAPLQERFCFISVMHTRERERGLDPHFERGRRREEEGDRGGGRQIKKTKLSSS